VVLESKMGKQGEMKIRNRGTASAIKDLAYILTVVTNLNTLFCTHI
jgi:hypothetical protein